MQGTYLGPYEILEQLGAGGMGEVWLAQDTRLGRRVAVKVLPEEFAADPERLARFEQEARASAALNHPNIAVVHDVGHDGSTHYMVQEHLRGETLRSVLERGRMPLNTGLALALEISEALAAAHAAGIVHRDLKPENVFVTEDGHAKVLDFGLAKLTEVTPAGGSGSMSPTVLGTVAGQIMGTVGYMAPEQIEGDRVDHRADLFAFGCVLFELAAGQRAFRGKNMVETLDRVANRDPEDLATIDKGLPEELAGILDKALAKSPVSRYQSAADMAVDLRALAGAVEAGTATSIADSRHFATAQARLPTGLVAAGLAAAMLVGAAAGIWLWQPEPVRERRVHFRFDLAGDAGFSRAGRRVLAVSPDGQHIAFTDEGSLNVRHLGDDALVRVPGVLDPSSPIFSPDGEWIAFWNDGELAKVPLQGGSPVSVGEMPHPTGTQWTSDNQILAAVQGLENTGDRIVRIDADGGLLETLIQLGHEGAEGPIALPGGEWILFGMRDGGTWDNGYIVAQSLATGERRELLQGTGVRYVAPEHLTFARGGNLFAVPFDPQQVQITGTPVQVVDGIQMTPSGGAYYDVSARGDLVFSAGGLAVESQSLGWYDRDGTLEVLPFEPANLQGPALSPDGTRVATGVMVGTSANIAIYDLERGTRQWLTNDPAAIYHDAAWSADGRWVYFVDENNIYRTLSNFGGPIETVLDNVHAPILGPVAQDARTMAIAHRPAGEIFHDAALLNLETGEVSTLTNTPDRPERAPEISPDGKLVAYSGFDGDLYRAYVRDLETSEVQVASTGGGFHPAWNSDGSELIFVVPDGGMAGTVHTVSVARDPALRIGRPRELFARAAIREAEMILSPDDRRILVVVPAPAADMGTDSADEVTIQVVLNWADDMRRRVGPQ